VLSWGGVPVCQPIVDRPLSRCSGSRQTGLSPSHDLPRLLMPKIPIMLCSYFTHSFWQRKDQCMTL